ncbi:molybdenum ABC transporter permease subunit [Compostibacillus humi]|uniref:Molybdenum transport system permease n=1 Tax=Compostibacillus humi TaxID=1245525 RepID=A0A8J2ZSQ5_9BACI|nr:molybdate ABC transporter permease subunit [Compostibacillus humi]GGH75177.1 molybdenum ABC transporter permease subunit [Compostibacillus humi]
MEWSWHPVQLSFYVAGTATFITFLLAVFAVFAVAVKKRKGRTLIETVFFMPLVLPPSVIGFILIVIFGNEGFIGKLIYRLTNSSVLFTSTAAVIAAVTVSFPLVYQSLKSGFLSVDKNIINAAKVDGATDWTIFWKIILPLAKGSALTGVILGFTRGFGEFGATFMFAGNIPGKTQTIPTAIYLAIEMGEMKIASYYALISIAFSFLFLSIIHLKDKKKPA